MGAHGSPWAPYGPYDIRPYGSPIQIRVLLPLGFLPLGLQPHGTGNTTNATLLESFLQCSTSSWAPWGPFTHGAHGAHRAHGAHGAYEAHGAPGPHGGPWEPMTPYGPYDIRPYGSPIQIRVLLPLGFLPLGLQPHGTGNTTNATLLESFLQCSTSCQS